MANATPSRVGQVNQAGDVDAIFLKVYGGEVVASFEKAVKMRPLHMVREIQSGKSAQFPAVGRIGSGYHTPGAEILGSPVSHAEIVIPIDDLLYSDAFIANIDEAKNHYDVRSQYSLEQGRELAKVYDQNVARNIMLASRAASTITGQEGGTELTNAAYSTDGSVLASGIFAAAQSLDENFVPEDDRYCAVKPAQYNLLVQTTDVINRDWGGMGVYSEGSVLKVAGVHILKHAILPFQNDSANTDIPTAYRGDFSAVVGMVWHKSAAATVQLLGLGLESEYDIRRQGTLMVAKYAVGHGFLRPESAVTLKTV